MIISFVQTKGGVAKSTLSRGFAYSKIVQRNRSVGLVDLDPQGTLTDWHKERVESGLGQKVHFASLSAKEKEDKKGFISRLKKDLTKIIDSNDLVVLDTPGESVSRFVTNFAIALSDIVMIPMRSSTGDEGAFSKIYPLIKSAHQESPEKKFIILPVFIHPRTKVETIKGYFDDIKPEETSCLNEFFPDRSVYQNFDREGMDQYEYAQLVKSNKKDSDQAQKAIKDINKIAKAILLLED